MSPREVRGLQALAKAHGGSLTINPDTGLVEAGFLDRLLPMIAGAALASTGVGALGAAAMVGGGVGLAKGDLKAGLMAGLGAYGGAGLAGGAMNLGANAGTQAASAEATIAGEQAAQQVATDAASQQAATQASNQAMQEAGTQSAAESARLAATAPPTVSPDVAAQSAKEYASNAAGNSYELAPQGGVQPANTGFSQATQNSLNQSQMGAGIDKAIQNPSAYVNATGGGAQTTKYGLASLASTQELPKPPEEEKYDGPLSKYSFDPEKYTATDRSQPDPYYDPRRYNYAGGGSIEQMSNANAVGMNTGYPMANMQQGAYATPWQTPLSQNVVQGTADTGVNRMNGEQAFAGGGGISNLGSYSDGGRMLKGPGDGMSDSIPAQIGSKQPARLADGEFVVPADVVSHLGNGSTDAGARQLYKMMDRIRQQRTGKKKQAPEVNPGKAMPA
jgi:hypothetical protein